MLMKLVSLMNINYIIAEKTTKNVRPNRESNS